MRKWRPAFKCTYVIPEVHGNNELFKIILNRILPLRFSANQEYSVILLGDYIDRGDDSADVIDLLLEVKAEYQDNFICLKGNHEQLLLDAFKSNENYQIWLLQGGSTTIQSYLTRAGLNSNPFSFPFSRLTDIIPLAHIEFLNSLPSCLEYDKYVLFHGGFNTSNPQNTDETTYMFDTGASRAVKQLIKDGKSPLPNSSKIYVGAHNYKANIPYVYSKYIMLGGSAPQNLILFELNSMTCAMVKYGKSRIYKHKFKYFE